MKCRMCVYKACCHETRGDRIPFELPNNAMYKYFLKNVTEDDLDFINHAK